MNTALLIMIPGGAVVSYSESVNIVYVRKYMCSVGPLINILAVRGRCVAGWDIEASVADLVELLR